MKRLLICALISLFGVVACQELYDEPINNDLSTAPLNNEIWYRTIDNSSLSLSGSHFNSTIDDVLFDGEYFRVKFAGTVTTIKEGAFNEYPQLELVYLPASIRRVEKLAFYGCENLKQFKGDVASDDGRVIIIDGELCAYAPKYMHSYTIPNQVLSIGEYAFYGCNELTEVIISDGVNEIKNCAFERCSNLRKVEFSRVDVIGERAFAECSSLEELDLPETLNEIGDSAFMDCDNLWRVDVPSSVEIIRTQTFMGCDALTEITLNDGLYSIEAKAFMDCYQLERVTIPASVGSVGQYLFSNCGNLKEVYCKAQTPPVLSSGSVDSWSAFDGCSSELRIYVPFESLSEYREAYGWSMYSSELVGYDFERGEVVPDGDDNHKIFYTATECVIPIYQSAFDAEYQTSYWNSKTGEGYLLFDRPVTEIGDSAFADCIALKSVTIPESVNIVGESAFRNCRALESFSGKFATYDGYALVVDNTFVAYAIGAAVKSYAIPEGVTTVESYAFFKGSKLEDVTIPSSVEQIEGDAFNECTSLKAVYCLPSTPPVALYGDNSWGAFDFNNANRIIYVPTDSLEEYVVADGWADYASQIVAFSSAEFEKLTVAEFLAKEDGETYYELTGEITDVVSTYYGNFDLTDSTGTVYIYGLYSPDGESYYWGESGVAEGDTITIQVQRSSYNGTAQGGNARYVSHVKGEEKVVVEVDITSFEYSEYDYTTDAYKYHLSCDSCSLDLYVDSSFVEGDAYQIMAGAYTWVPINLFGGYNNSASFTTDNISVVEISNSVESGSMLVMGSGDIDIELVMDDSATMKIHCDATLFGGEPTPEPEFTLSTPEILNIGATDVVCSICYTLVNPIEGVDIEVIYDASWITDFAVSEETITLFVEANDSETERSAQVTISYGDISYTVTITQAGAIIEDFEPTHIATEWIWDGLSAYGNRYNVLGEDFSLDVHFNEDVCGEDFINEGDYEWIALTSFNGAASNYFTVRSVKFGGSTVVVNSGTLSVTKFGSSYTLNMTLNSSSATYMVQYKGDSFVDIPDWYELAYTTNDGQAIDLYTTEGFGAVFMENYYDKSTNQGSLRFETPMTAIPENAFLACSNLVWIDIPNSVTSIGAKAFYGCTSIEEITIPASVTSIGSEAFKGCGGKATIRCNLANDGGWYGDVSGQFGGSKFTEVELGDAVTDIGYGTFRDCDSLTSITIPDSVTTIQDYAFYDCDSLASIYIPDSVTTLGSNVFYGCDLLAEAYIGAGVTGLKTYLFYNCSKLSTVTIGEGVTSIEYAAFYGCESLASVTIPSKVETIYGSVFYNCKSLSVITLGEGVTTIQDNAFRYCESLKRVNISSIDKWLDMEFSGLYSVPTSSGAALYVGDEVVTSVIIPDNVTTFGQYLFAGCSSITRVDIGKRVTEIGYYAFYNCSNLAEVYLYPPIPPTLSTSSTFSSNADGRIFYVPAAALDDYKAASVWSGFANSIEAMEAETPETWKLRYTATALVEPYDASAFNVDIVSNKWDEATGEGVITFDGELTTIGEEAFYECSSLTSVTVGDSVTTIGNLAFRDSNSLTSVTIPDSVTTIGYGAFYNCTSLTSVTIPDSVTTIGDSAFSKCSSLTSVTIGDSITTIEEYAFLNCNSLTSVTIGNSVTTIGNYAFYDCTSLTSVTIPDSVTTIGDTAFYNCSSLTSVYCKPITTPTLGSNVFKMYIIGTYINIGCPIYVPAESLETYKAAYGWSDYAEDIVGYDFETGEVVE